ncbi:multicopper oxidase-domain-containing protein [Protomyces lactucae-debilis]|uniref:Multicopper oxidase-domain-containing protein n=1 Tax=Protomyces lactucae-debilis TaxID=2754530 RepID=A0A1Y2FNA4_PROLT|nr:multicopper oxidase-domain-containing protein [Protomyces lactucae-debilis]ORY85438.1 multicopper oxidase-domain-containing protein [Protomyces lactucae-debilis]
MPLFDKRRPPPLNIEMCNAFACDYEEAYSLKTISESPSTLPSTLPSLAQFQLSPIQSHRQKERWLYVTAAVTISLLLLLMLLEFRDSQEPTTLRPLSDYVLRHPRCDEVVRKWTWTIEELNGKLTVNGKFPGPLVEANVGDAIYITVRNRLDTATSLHFFGLNTSQTEDGMPFISQDPIFPGEEIAISIDAAEAGTFLWGSLTDVQRLDGLAGVLVVHPDCKQVAREFVLLVSDVYSKPASQLLDTYLAGPLERPISTGISVCGRDLAEVAPAAGMQRYRIVHAGSTTVSLITDTSELIEPGQVQIIPAARLRWSLDAPVHRPSVLLAKTQGKVDYTLTISVESRNGHARHTVNNISYVPANYALASKPVASPLGLGTPYSPDILTITHQGEVALRIINTLPTLQPLYFHGHQIREGGHIASIPAHASKVVHLVGTQKGLWAAQSMDEWSAASGLTFLIQTM